MIPPVPPFPRHCEGEFEHLSVHDGPALIRLLTPDELPPHLLTYAAEWAGDIPVATPGLVEALLALLGHPDPGVREGAVYGLLKLTEDRPDLRELVLRHTDPAVEPSPGVRRAAGG